MGNVLLDEWKFEWKKNLINYNLIVGYFIDIECLNGMLLRRLKTRSRSKMKQETLCGWALLLNIHRQIDLSVNDIIKRFTQWITE